MKFKIVFNNDIRIFNTTNNNLDDILPEIRTFVDQSFGIENFNATYIDEEDEKVTISQTSDLIEALNRYKIIKETPKIFINIRERSRTQKLNPTNINDTNWVTRLQQRYHDPEDVKKLQDTQSWIVEPAKFAMATRNKIREVVDKIDMTQIPSNKEFISIAIGDPTKFPNLLPSSIITQSVQDKLLSQRHNGYVMSYGLTEARVAISKKYSYPHIPINEEDIILASGCSDALNMAICSILNDGDNFLIPKPGFSFYETLASRYNFEPKFYNLLPDKEWQIDVKHMRSLIDKNTKVILINNPSNPCGSVLRRNNLLDVLKLAEDYSIPIISDEIYGGMVYDDNNGIDKFYSVASLSYRVPILTLSGLSKQYLVPGWRVGWIVIHDPIGAFNKIRVALQKLSTLILGANTLIQSSIPSILFEIPDTYYNELNDKLYRQSTLLYNELNNISELKPIKGRGALYLMVKIKLNKLKNINDDVDFANKLLREEGILVLPGQIFNMKNYFRTVVCPPPHIIHEIGKRLKRFCNKYSKQQRIISSKL